MLAVTEGAPRPCKRRLPGHDTRPRHHHPTRQSSHTRIVAESSSLSAVVDRLQHTFMVYRHFALHCADVECFSSSGPTTSCCSVGLPNISPRMRWLGGASLEHCTPKFRQLLALRFACRPLSYSKGSMPVVRSSSVPCRGTTHHLAR